MTALSILTAARAVRVSALLVGLAAGGCTAPGAPGNGEAERVAAPANGLRAAVIAAAERLPERLAPGFVRTRAVSRQSQEFTAEYKLGSMPVIVVVSIGDRGRPSVPDGVDSQVVAEAFTESARVASAFAFSGRESVRTMMIEPRGAPKQRCAVSRFMATGRNLVTYLCGTGVRDVILQVHVTALDLVGTREAQAELDQISAVVVGDVTRVVAGHPSWMENGTPLGNSLQRIPQPAPASRQLRL